jgi:H+/Cl- antiporter ClcA
MQKENRLLIPAFQISLIFLTLAAIFFLAFLYLEMAPDIKPHTETLAYILFIISQIAFYAALLSCVYEIYFSKNETKWKILWAAIVLILGIIGFLAYWHFARKDLQY